MMKILVVVNIVQYGFAALNFALLVTPESNLLNLAAGLACLIMAIWTTRVTLKTKKLDESIKESEQRINELWDKILRASDKQN